MAYNFNPFTGNFDETSAGASVAGSDTQVQYNDSGSLGASADLTWDDSGKVLGVGGDIDLDDGGTYTTTLQTVTPTQNRTISFPDLTGTIGLVAGSNGQVIYNSSGANAGLATVTTDGTNVTLTGRFISSLNGAASAPPGTFTGTWFTGGTSTTTKPQVLIEPTGTTSTAWSTSGTGLGVNAASGFSGNLLDLQLNGIRRLSLSAAGQLTLASLSTAGFALEYASAVTGFTNQRFRIDQYGTIALTVETYAPANAGIGVLGPSDTFLRIAVGLDTGTPFIGFGPGNAGRDTFLVRDAAGTLAQRNGTNAQAFRCYGTYTDASNYVRAALSSTSTAVTLAAETAGTGDDNIPLNLTAAGTGTVKVNSNLEVSTKDIVTDDTTGTKIGTATTQKLGFFGVTPVVQQTELTDELTTITHTAPGTPDYAIQNLTDTGGFGFASADEGNTVLSVIANLQTRVNELETKLVALGLLADAD